MIRNWSGNLSFKPRRYCEPSSLEELQREVAEADSCRVLGTRHSFSSVGVSLGTSLSLRRMQSTSLKVDISGSTATFDSHITFAHIGAELHAKGYALPNLPSLPHISVCGAMATATHGSGLEQPILTAMIRGFTYVAGDGVVRAAGPKDAVLDGIILGAAGAIITLTVKVVPAFQVQQGVYGPVPWKLVDDCLEELMASAYSVSLFTDYGPAGCHQLWLKQRVTGDVAPPLPDMHFGLKRVVGPVAANGQLHPAGLDGSNCTEQGSPGPWHQRLPHFRPDRPPSSHGDELQSEWFVPITQAKVALKTLRSLHDVIKPVLWISEVRTVAADNFCLSPCCGRACLAIGFTWKFNEAAVRTVLPIVEDALRPLGMLPHWGKLTDMKPRDLAAAYISGPQADRVRQLASILIREDPFGKFGSEQVRALLDAASLP